MRKHYIDNLKWMIILVLIPYHAGMAFNAWGESNYIMLDSDKLISSFLVFFSPWFMPLLFLLAGTVCVVGAEFFVCKCVDNHLAIFLLTSLLSYTLVFSIIALVQNHPHFK